MRVNQPLLAQTFKTDLFMPSYRNWRNGSMIKILWFECLVNREWHYLKGIRGVDFLE